MGLTITAIRRPIFICVFVFALIIFGVMGQKKMPKELIPKIDVPYVLVMVTYPGAGPTEVENQINQVLEQNLAGIENLKNITSIARDSNGMVVLEFYLGTDLSSAAADVRDKVSVARGSLPDGIDEPVVQKVDIGAMSVMDVSLNGTLSSRELRTLAKNVVSDEFATVPGVSNVSINGGDVRELKVDIDAKRLNAYNIGLSDVTGAISAATMNVPAGTLRVGEYSYSVRTMGEFITAEDMANVKITSKGKDGTSFYLRDVAKISDGIAEPDTYTRIDGKDGVLLSVSKSSDGNTVEVVNGVKKKIKELNDKVLPPGAKLSLVTDDAKMVDISIFEVNKALGEAIVIVIFIILLFLHSIRGTFIVAIAIPTSLLATYGPISAMGFSLNMMTLLALSLVVGILVDDSIVILENIERHIKKGESIIDAAINGRSEIGFAAIAISLVDIVVFLPVAFMGGIVGQFFRQFGVTVACAVAFSLFMSFTLTPMLASKWMKSEADSEKEEHDLKEKITNGTAGVIDKINYGFVFLMDKIKQGLEAITIAYRGVLEWALKNKYTAVSIGFFILLIVFSLSTGYFSMFRIVLMVLLALSTVFAIAKQPDKLAPVVFGIICLIILFSVKLPLSVSFAPVSDSGKFDITIRMPEGTSLQATDKVVKEVEKIVAEMPYMKSVEKEYTEFLIYNPMSWFKKHKEKLEPHYITVVGNTATSSMSSGDKGDNYAIVQCNIWEKKFRPGVGIQDVIDSLYPKLAKIAGPKSINVQIASTMGRDGANGVAYKVSGQVDMEVLNSVANQVASVLEKTKGLTGIDVSYKPGSPEKQIKIRRDKIADMELKLSDVGSAVRVALNGNTDTKFREKGYEYDIDVRYRPEDRSNVDNVSDVIVTNKNGKPVYIKDIADISNGFAPNKIEREARLRKITVSSSLMKGYSLGNCQQQAEVEIQKIKLPVGVTISSTGSSEDMKENFGYIFSALFLAILLVYLLMCALFESLLTPFVIMFALPQALAGAVLALLITGQQLNMISLIGIIMLVGLVTKNAILMCDFTNTLRSRGLTKHEALVAAGSARLRPIMMTTIAMIGGMTPIAISNSQGSEMRSPLGIAVIGGLSVSMLLTLLIIPVMYDIVDAVWKSILKWPMCKGLKALDDAKEDEWTASRSDDFDPNDAV